MASPLSIREPPSWCGRCNSSAARPSRGETVARLENNRNLHLAAGHVAQARRLVEHLAHSDEHEFAHPQLDDRAQAGHRRADGDSQLSGLRDWRDADAILAERADHRIAIRHSQILSIENNVGIALHLFGNCDGHRFGVHHFTRHERSFFYANTYFVASSGAGKGLARANCTASSNSARTESSMRFAFGSDKIPRLLNFLRNR